MAKSHDPTADDGSELDQYDVSALDVNTDSDRFAWFANKVVQEANSMLVENARSPYAEENDVVSAEDVQSGVLSPDNVYEVKIRDRELTDTTVTFWLNDAPNWANDAKSVKLIDTGLRGDCHVVIDIRQF